MKSLRYKVEIMVRLHEPLEPEKLKELLYEQWEQTAAHLEGDAIAVLSANPIE